MTTTTTMDEPTALFDSYEHDFNQLINDVKQKLDVDSAGGKDAEAKKAALRRVELILDEADEMISQMQLEIQGIPKSLKSKYTPRLKNSQAELLRWKKLSREAHGKMQRGELFARSGAFGGMTSDEPYGTTDDRTRLLVGHEVLEDGTRRLRESESVALETEGLGASILSSLRRQREQIENSRDVLHTADTSIDRASSTLKKMIRRMYQQRVVIAAMVVVLIVVILLILWAKLWR